VDRAALERAIAPYRTPEYVWREVGPGLEDVFIHLMGSAERGRAS
jgi:ABC-2 type transport system ATP-binding protein